MTEMGRPVPDIKKYNNPYLALFREEPHLKKKSAGFDHPTLKR